jgi:glycosyltransferase involved in cell wall biosynthesis
LNARRILFISKGEDSSATRYRALQYFPLLERHGWRPQHLTDQRTLGSRWRILQSARQAEVVVVVRRTVSDPFRFLLRRMAKTLVFDFDDAIFLRSSGESSRLKERRFARMLRACDQAWAGNPYLAAAARRWNSRVTLLPTALEPDKYANAAARPKPEAFVDLVWIGSRSTRKHLVTALPALERAAQDNPRLRLKVIADFSIATLTLPILAIPWSEQNEAQELACSHIGIAPLPDNPFTRGKCGLKVLQYMAAGLPVVSSPTGVNAELVEPGKTGLLAESSDDWVKAIATLAKDVALRQAFGQAGQAKCREGYALDRVLMRLLETL